MSREPLESHQIALGGKRAAPQASLGQSRRVVPLAPAVVLLVVGLAVAAGLASVMLPGTLIEREAAQLSAGVIFAASYVALAVGRVPGLAIDRAGVALVGASLMVAGGALPLDRAYKAVDLDTLTLLLGMMIIVANLRLSGFFVIAGGWVMRRAHRAALFAGRSNRHRRGVFRFSGQRCGLPDADAARHRADFALRRNPVPYLLAVAMASNIGSAATITGNPQNMMIGSFSRNSLHSFRGRAGARWRWSGCC